MGIRRTLVRTNKTLGLLYSNSCKNSEMETEIETLPSEIASHLQKGHNLPRAPEKQHAHDARKVASSHAVQRRSLHVHVLK